MESNEKVFEFSGNRWLITPDGLGARRWNKTRGAWEKKISLFAACNEDFRAASMEAK